MAKLISYIGKKCGHEEPITVHLFEHDEKRMKELVLRHPAKETGGNLFGLWTDKEEPVLHIVLGPANGCTRTEVSFYQSIPYLERVGGIVTQDYQLCHIGEWHSHHRLRLSEPSSGDSSTIIRNFPRGTCGFLLIIANIQPSSDAVTLSPYLYREGERHYERCKINLLRGQSPFAGLDPILRHMQQGEDKSSTIHEFLQREQYKSKTSTESTHSARDNSPYTFIFEEDYNMIKKLLLESEGNEIEKGGDLFGLWTTDEQPVLHTVSKPLAETNERQPCEPSNSQPQDARKGSGGENLAFEEYQGIQKIGKYILRRPLSDKPIAEGEDKPTADEEANFRQQFPLRCVLVVAYIVQYDQGAKSVGISSYVYSGYSSPNKPLEIKVLPASKVFPERQKGSDKTEENKSKEEENLMDVDSPPDSPSQQNIMTP